MKNTKVTREKLGNKIKSCRVAIGMSQKDLARILKTTDRSVSAYEVGRIMPSLRVLQQLSQLFQKPLSYFDDNANIDIQDIMKRVNVLQEEITLIKKKLNQYQ